LQYSSEGELKVERDQDESQPDGSEGAAADSGREPACSDLEAPHSEREGAGSDPERARSDRERAGSERGAGQFRRAGAGSEAECADAGGSGVSLPPNSGLEWM